MFNTKIKNYLKKKGLKKPDYRIVYVKNDRDYGTYYKIEVKHFLGYQTYYFRIPNSIFFDQHEFRFKTFDSAKEELDLLVQGKSKYNCFKEIVYEASRQNQ